VQTIAANTLDVLTDMPEKRTEWRQIITGNLQKAHITESALLRSFEC